MSELHEDFERALRDDLDRALRQVVPGDPPVRGTMRRGRSIRFRRRAGAVASVAAVGLFAAFGFPALTGGHALRPPGPAQHRPATVTDLPPGPGGHRAGLIAAGLINGKAWQVTATRPGSDGTSKGRPCFGASGAAFDSGVGYGAGAGAQTMQCFSSRLLTTDAGVPVNFLPFSTGDVVAAGGVEVLIGTVRADVRYVVVDLGDGTRLKLIPVSLFGARYVAFPDPPALAVDSATAYLANGKYLTAIPFMAPHGLVIFAMWLPQGQPGMARATGLVASGKMADGGPWAVYVYRGPWGWCIDAASTLECVPLTLPGTEMLGAVGADRGVIFGTAEPGVSYVRLTLAGGGTRRVNVTAIAGQLFFASYLRNEQTLRRWTAYDAAGKKVASGTLTLPSPPPPGG